MDRRRRISNALLWIFILIACVECQQETNDGKEEKELQFWPAFVNSLSMIIATEIGDKTFFIAAVMSMSSSRLAVFSGAFLALVVMTILSTLMGLVLPSLLPRTYTHILGGVLFVYFGVKLVYESISMDHKVSDELEEVEEELNNHGKKQDVETEDLENGSNEPLDKKTEDFIGIFMKSLTLTFLAEWGDRSQIATIALSSSREPYGVTVGGCLGHGLCTGIACIGGRLLATKISEKSVSFYGGLTFCGFGFHALFFES